MLPFKDYIKKKTSVEKPKQEFKSKAGAGEDASFELVKNYKRDTPGQ
jgi:hypothetical protein